MKINRLKKIFRKCCATCGHGQLTVSMKDDCKVICNHLPRKEGVQEPLMEPGDLCRYWRYNESELRRALVTRVWRALGWGSREMDQ